MDEKRLEILERASTVYMRLGIKSVTMDDLARELGISKKTIYKYFDDKSDLVRSIVRMKTEMDQALCMNCINQNGNAIDDLIQVSKLIAEHIGNVNPTVFHDVRKYHPDAWQVMENHRWGFVLNTIVNNIEKGQEEGIFRDDLNPQVIGRVYVSSMDTLFNPDIFPWPKFTFQEVYSEVIRYHIKGLVNDNGLEYLRQKIYNGEF
ncbi:MAG: TetR/AcrR family transcriptional regulator [bacterium]|nr:TetR/AcrR family transcriptional regulator [bacterium]